VSLEAKVKNIVVEVVHKVRPESTAREAAAIMVERGVGCLIVSGIEGPVGMVTERDLLRKAMSNGADPNRVRIRDIMSVPLISVTMDTSVGEAAKKMVENNIKRLAVVGEDGTFLGLITMTDIVRWVAKQKELSEALINYLTYDVP
jgi:CBS domain-containing protein